jgi:hypothetical protein
VKPELFVIVVEQLCPAAKPGAGSGETADLIVGVAELAFKPLEPR